MLRALIAPNDFQPLCGREWISALNLDWHDYISEQAESLTVQSNKSNKSKSNHKTESVKPKGKSCPVPESCNFDLDQFSELFLNSLN